MATITVGDAAIDRASSLSFGNTYMSLGNPANAGGILDTAEVWAATSISGLRVGTFYLVSGTTYKCRDSMTIGSVTAGAKQTFTGLSLAVQQGDFIGCYFTGGSIERDTSGGSGLRYKSGEYIDPGDEASFTLFSNNAMSLRCTGSTVALEIYPPGHEQPIAYGTPQLNLSIYPPGHQQVIAYGTPTVTVGGAAITIYPPGLQVVIAYGTPALRYPQTISPPGLNVPIAYGTPTLIPGTAFIYVPGHEQVIAYGTPKLILTIKPSGIAQTIAYGTPSLKYPQTISPPGLNVPIAYGTPSIASGVIVIYVPGHQQAIAYGTPTILKYVWHLILDGQYNVESPETNRTFVIGRDVYGNPVWGEAHDAMESALVGERLDFQPDPAIPTTAQAADVAAAVLSKLRLSKKRGVILIPYNCGQELWDVVQITDAGANQSAVSFRVVGIRFEYHPRQARYEHRLLLGAP